MTLDDLANMAILVSGGLVWLGLMIGIVDLALAMRRPVIVVAVMVTALGVSVCALVAGIVALVAQGRGQ